MTIRLELLKLERSYKNLVFIIMSTVAATTGEILSKSRQAIVQEQIYRFTHGLGAAAMQYFNPGLIKPHERAQANTTGNKDFNSMSRQISDGSQTTALLVRSVGQGKNILYFIISNFYQSVKVAMTEMGVKK